MQKFGKKQIIICAIAALVTFVLTTLLCFCVGMRLYSRSLFGDRDSKVLSEVKTYIDALYLEDYDEASLYQAAAKGMTDALDDYTVYYTPEEFAAFITSTRGAYVGVGLVLSVNAENQIIIMQVYEESPGAEAGVQAGDILLRIDGEDYSGDLLDEAAAALRGDGSDAQGEGSLVQATFLRGEEEYTTSVTRREIHLKTVASRKENNVGYFKITSFDEDTDAEFKNQYQALAAQGIKSIVIDLRDNGGGDYYTVCRLAGMFLEEGDTVVYRMDKKGTREYEYAEGYCIDLPVVILANGHSASASEVLIGALSGNDRLHALVGTKTFGKGITQDVFSLRSGGGLSITVDRYYTPDDQCIHGIGFEPDVQIESGYDENYPVAAIAPESDLQLQKALEIANNL